MGIEWVIVVRVEIMNKLKIKLQKLYGNWSKPIIDIQRARYLSEDEKSVYIHNKYIFEKNNFTNRPLDTKWPFWKEVKSKIPNYNGRVKKALKMDKTMYYEAIKDKPIPILNGANLNEFFGRSI